MSRFCFISPTIYTLNDDVCTRGRTLSGVGWVGGAVVSSAAHDDLINELNGGDPFVNTTPTPTITEDVFVSDCAMFANVLEKPIVR